MYCRKFIVPTNDAFKVFGFKAKSTINKKTKEKAKEREKSTIYTKLKYVPLVYYSLNLQVVWNLSNSI